MAEQLMLPLFEIAERVPFHCADEGKTVDIGGGKSYCLPWERWTNCRSVGYCVYKKYGMGE